MDGGQAVYILDRLEVAVDDELAVGAPHLAVKLPVGGSIAGCGIVIRVGARPIEEGEVTVTPGQGLVFGWVAAMLPDLSFAEESGLLQRVEAGKLVRRQVCLFPGQHLVHLPRG